MNGLLVLTPCMLRVTTLVKYFCHAALSAVGAGTGTGFAASAAAAASAAFCFSSSPLAARAQCQRREQCEREYTNIIFHKFTFSEKFRKIASAAATPRCTAG